MAPVVSSAIGPTAGGALVGNGQRGWWKDASFEPRVLVVPRLPGADRVTGRDQHELVGGRKLHHLACGQERPCRLLARDHEMSEPWRQAVARIVLHGAQLSRDAECVRDAFGGALVVGREGDPDMAIVENGGHLEQYPLSAISALAERGGCSTHAKVSPRSRTVLMPGGRPRGPFARHHADSTRERTQAGEAAIRSS